MSKWGDFELPPLPRNGSNPSLARNGSSTHLLAASGSPPGGGGGGGGARPAAPRPRTALLTGLAAALVVLLAFGSGWHLGQLVDESRARVRGAEAVARAPLALQQGAAAGQREQGGRADGDAGGGAALDGEAGPVWLGMTQRRRRPGQRWCPYGALRGAWVGGAPPGARWQLLDGGCRLDNLLVAYATNGSNATASGAAGGGSAGGGEAAAAAAPAAAAAGRPGSGGGAAARGALPPLRILLLSDSVDRYVTSHACAFLGGNQQSQPAHEVAGAGGGGEPAAGAGAPAPGPGGRRRLRRRARRQLQQPGDDQHPQGQGGAAGAGKPSDVYTTAYSLHKCVTDAPLWLASSYIPGVHPSGPWHRNVTQAPRQRIDSAARLWHDFAGDDDPDVVSVSALLWDVARLYFHERPEVEGPELSRQLLQGWMANFTNTLLYARSVFPKAKVWATHTTLTPRFDPTSGLAAKPYLGRPYYVAQLNGALLAVAARLGLQVVDYWQVGARFSANQSHLVDLIHPVEDIGLEVTNLYLNLAAQAHAAPPPAPAWDDAAR
ncbi:MAG: hypothetical protein J3K34DRAFT_524567 [Monoraphidium minutum]|nr:MAG: hypothetical protein J3K34DRAFT_524567 [Monoraphidium minutum]